MIILVLEDIVKLKFSCKRGGEIISIAELSFLQVGESTDTADSPFTYIYLLRMPKKQLEEFVLCEFLAPYQSG